MALLLIVFATVVAVSGACGTNAGIPERPQKTPVAANVMRVPAGAAILVPENPADRSIRRDLDIAIAGDAELQHRDISFIVANGDVSVIGTVRTEEERRKINGLAFDIGSVKSVANALRVAE
jgi:osmotically-inducible protein OsmY